MNMLVLESVAKALIINPKNEALILTLGEHKQRPEKSFKPDLPGGLVDPGESDRDGVIREIQEETGIDIDPNEAIPVYSKTEFYSDENKSVTKHLFVVNLDSIPTVQLSWEHSAYQWVALEELQNSILRSFYDEAIKYCFTHNILATTKTNADKDE